MKRRLIVAVAAIFLSGFAIASFLNSPGNYYTKYENYKYGFLPYYSTIDKKCSEADREMAQSVIDLAGKIMTDTDGSVHKSRGELDFYSVDYNLSDREIEKVDAKLNLITADFTFSNGYMWVEYHKQSYDKNGDIAENYESLAYWKLKKQDGEWKVVKIKDIRDIVNNKAVYS